MADQNSTSGMIIFYNGDLVNWVSKKQTVVSMYAAEAEYISFAAAVQQLQAIPCLCL